MRLIHVSTVPMSLHFLKGQAAFMASAGIETHVVSTPGSVLETVAREEGTTAHGVPMQRQIAPLADVVALWRLYRLFKRLRPSIVHAHTPKAGLLAMIAARCARVPRRIYHVHGLPMMTRTGSGKRLLIAADRVACNAATDVLCVSGSVRAICIAEKICRDDKIRVLLRGSINGVDAAHRFDPLSRASLRRRVRDGLTIPADAPVMLFVGRLVRDKGVCELAAAWKLVKSSHRAARLIIVGPFEAKDAVPGSIRRELHADVSVHLVGEDWNVAPYYAASDVVVFPTFREGFPVVPLEAAAMALPVVASRVPGCIDAIEDGTTGTLVPASDVAALATAVSTYIANPSLARRHGEAARSRVLRDFRPADMWEALLGVYRERPPSPSEVSGSGIPTRYRAGLYLRFGKPLFDAFVALMLLVVLAPIMLLTAALVRATMGWPVLFAQTRPGKSGKPFTILKFRTMRAAGPESQSDAERLTPVGEWLRSLSLDELPELWNVLRGDMSLVGPRPLLTQYLGRYNAEQARRHEVLPGITGWAQVNGRNALSWDEKFRCDVWYVDHCSFRLDLQILAMTLWTIVRRDGINAPGHATAPEFMRADSTTSSNT